MLSPQSEGGEPQQGCATVFTMDGCVPAGSTIPASKSWGPRAGFTVHHALCFVLHQLRQWHAAEAGEGVEPDFAAQLPEPAVQG